MLETKQHEYAVRQKDTQMAGEKSRKITENAGVQSQQSFQIPFTVRLSDSFSQDPSDFFVLQWIDYFIQPLFTLLLIQNKLQ